MVIAGRKILGPTLRRMTVAGGWKRTYLENPRVSSLPARFCLRGEERGEERKNERDEEDERDDGVACADEHEVYAHSSLWVVKPRSGQQEDSFMFLESDDPEGMAYHDGNTKVGPIHQGDAVHEA